MPPNQNTLIQRLRSKPSHVRHMIAFGSSTALLAVIATAWALSLPSRFASGSEDESARAQTVSPFEVFSDSLREALPSQNGAENTDPSLPSGFENTSASSSVWY